ncbi:hypothetical protein GGX14DRAFT_573165 [Mycena pura]|uniref:Uncharacterized protein n=1 Tax=Mycena pura TaxID=153505 RepID=A0AAD6V089_9AGAR|nr:hypothetical protein GGX14DRAFT_573165 [Mycena pura]
MPPVRKPRSPIIRHTPVCLFLSCPSYHQLGRPAPRPIHIASVFGLSQADVDNDAAAWNALANPSGNSSVATSGLGSTTSNDDENAGWGTEIWVPPWGRAPSDGENTENAGWGTENWVPAPWGPAPSDGENTENTGWGWGGLG